MTANDGAARARPGVTGVPVGWPRQLAPRPPSGSSTLDATSIARRDIVARIWRRAGGLAVRCVGRDAAEGSADVFAWVDVELTSRPNPVVESARAGVRIEGGVDARLTLNGLIGRPAGRGFRAAADAAAAQVVDDDRVRSLLAAVLFDLPIMAILSASADPPLGERPDANERFRSPVDICAGFRQGAPLHIWSARRGPGRLGIGPAAPDDSDLPWTPPPEFSVRSDAIGTVTRQRCITFERASSARPGESPGHAFRSWFRDTIVEADQRHTVIHEYAVAGTTTGRGVVRTCAATAVVLPAPECPAAATSVQRVVGTPVEGIADLVDETFTGITTCTHLNDSLRALGALAGVVRSPTIGP